MGDTQLLEKYVVVKQSNYSLFSAIFLCETFCYIPYFHLLDGLMILQLIVYCRAAYAAMDAEDYCIC